MSEVNKLSAAATAAAAGAAPSALSVLGAEHNAQFQSGKPAYLPIVVGDLEVEVLLFLLLPAFWTQYRLLHRIYSFTYTRDVQKSVVMSCFFITSTHFSWLLLKKLKSTLFVH